VCTSNPSYTEYYVAEVKLSSNGALNMIITNLYNHFSASAPGVYQPEDTQVEVLYTATGLDIPLQYWTAPGLQDFRVSGTGSYLSGNTFTINYLLEDTSYNTSDQCTVTYVKQ